MAVWRWSLCSLRRRSTKLTDFGFFSTDVTNASDFIHLLFIDLHCSRWPRCSRKRKMCEPSLKRSNLRICTGWPKKFRTLFVRLITSSLTSFKPFHCRNQDKMCNNTITKGRTAHQVCRYNILWNVSVLKAITENKTTSVTKHFGNRFWPNLTRSQISRKRPRLSALLRLNWFLCCLHTAKQEIFQRVHLSTSRYS